MADDAEPQSRSRDRRGRRLGLGPGSVGSSVSTLGAPGAFGWVAYAPLSHAVYSGPGLTLTPLEDLLLWLGLVVARVGGSMRAALRQVGVIA